MGVLYSSFLKKDFVLKIHKGQIVKGVLNTHVILPSYLHDHILNQKRSVIIHVTYYM